MIKDNLAKVEENLAKICRRLGRKREDITLIGVTKYADWVKLKEAVDAGLRHVGENRVQHAEENFPILEEMPVKVTKHMIGHLQTNKVRDAIAMFDLIQSVDSEKLAEEIEAQAIKSDHSVNILIQVNTSNEPQKFGIDENHLFPLLDKTTNLYRIKVCGLMTIGPLSEDPKLIRQCFIKLRKLSQEVSKKYAGSQKIKMQYLSMGMTNDYQIALEEGSNMIRVGRAIFSDEVPQ